MRRRVIVRRRMVEVRRVLVSSDVAVGQMHACEGRFSRMKYVRTILGVVASLAEDYSLENIYPILGWPQSREDLEVLLSDHERSSAVTGVLIVNLNYALTVLEYSSWRIRNPRVLGPTRAYPPGWCWAVAVAKQLEALLKLNNILEDHLFLSVQDVINNTPRGPNGDDGSVRSLYEGRHAPLAGVVTEDFCPMGSAMRIEGAVLYRTRVFKTREEHLYSEERWEELIENEISNGVPFAASVLWFNSYQHLNPDGLYAPNEEEVQEYNRNPASKHLSAHTMLLSGEGVDENGTAYLEFQDTAFGDLQNGDRGYLRFERYGPCPPVIDFVSMRL